MWTPCSSSLVLKVVHSFGRANQHRGNSTTTGDVLLIRIWRDAIQNPSTLSCGDSDTILMLLTMLIFTGHWSRIMSSMLSFCLRDMFTCLSKIGRSGQKNNLLSVTIQHGCGRFMVAWVHLRECCCIAVSLDCHSVDLFWQTLYWTLNLLVVFVHKTH